MASSWGPLAGMGFAALESSGYTFNAFLLNRGKSDRSCDRDFTARDPVTRWSWHMDSHLGQRVISGK